MLLIVSILVGGLGVDRFMTGHIGTGVLKLITAGGCAIWWLYDVIQIATGKFADADGNLVVKQ
jgi:TM2 domain-containing membrane protein YozV